MYDKNSNGWIKHKDLVFLVFYTENPQQPWFSQWGATFFHFLRFEKNITSSEPGGTFNFSTFNSKLPVAVSQRRQQQHHHHHSPASPNGIENNLSVQTSAFGEEHLKRTTLR